MISQLLNFQSFGIFAVLVRLMKSLGLGFVVFKGFSWILDYLGDQIFTSLESLPSKAFALALMVGVDHYLQVVVAALVVRFFIGTAGRDTLKTLGFKGD